MYGIELLTLFLKKCTKSRVLCKVGFRDIKQWSKEIFANACRNSCIEESCVQIIFLSYQSFSKNLVTVYLNDKTATVPAAAICFGNWLSAFVLNKGRQFFMLDINDFIFTQSTNAKVAWMTVISLRGCYIYSWKWFDNSLVLPSWNWYRRILASMV